MRGELNRVEFSNTGMVATAHWAATEAGVSVLEAGGNAFDAAAAAAFALGVCEPAASGLGGQTMALLYVAKTRRTLALDGSSRAPNLTAAYHFSKKDRFDGYRATTVPSTPAVLDHLRRRFGRLRRGKVLAPAIRLAEKGFPVSALMHALTVRELKNLQGGTAARLFLRGGKRPYDAGETFRQPVLARTLRRLAAAGVKDFYRGKIAGMIASDMARHGGLIGLADLAQIPEPIERKPVAGKFGNDRVFTMPEPGAGRALIEMLQLFDNLPARLQKVGTPQASVALAEVIRQAYVDRGGRPFDPNYFAQVRNHRMLSEEYAIRIARKLQLLVDLRGETTHLSVMDQEGNCCALTQSIERVYGSKVATPELGFLYNNYMSAYETKDITHPYALRPNAAPWASVAPTILMRGGRPRVVIGSPGSERISSAILQVLARMRTVSPYLAVAAPRMHCSLGGKVSIETSGTVDPILRALRRKKFKIDKRERYSFYLGCIAMVVREGKNFIGIADPRRDGSAGSPRR